VNSEKFELPFIANKTITDFELQYKLKFFTIHFSLLTCYE